MKRVCFGIVALCAVAGVTMAAADWPQWQGPDRTGISKETGLLKAWPANGPSGIWAAQNLGHGYGSMALAGERVCPQGMRAGNRPVFGTKPAGGRSVGGQ